MTSGQIIRVAFDGRSGLKPSVLARTRDGLSPGSVTRLTKGHCVSMDGEHWAPIEEGRDYTYFELRTMIEGSKP